MNSVDWDVIYLSLELASITTLILLIIGLPLAWWLANSKSLLSSFILTLSTLPLVLPPTVLGFYLLILLSPEGALGSLINGLGLPSLVFSFWGLVLGSVIYSLPFTVQPLVSSFKSIDQGLLESARTLGARGIDRFTTIVVPLSRPGIYVAVILTFAHTLGEFGVILMIGGNIPGETKVLSIAIYEHVDALEYDRAHILAAGMLGFSFLTLWIINRFNQTNTGLSRQ